MANYRSGALRIVGSRLELVASRPDGSLIEVGLEVEPSTVHAIQHLAAGTAAIAGRPSPVCASRSLLDRALLAVGAAAERVEVLPGTPPRFVLVLVSPEGCLRRIDLDLVELVELVSRRRLPVVAVGWPDADWDAGLRALLGDG